MTVHSPEARLAAAGFTVPEVSSPRGSYAPYRAVEVGPSRWVSIAGQVCRQQGVAMAGQCQSEADVEPARRAAEVSMLNALAALRVAADGELSRVIQIVRLRGFISPIIRPCSMRPRPCCVRHSLIRLCQPAARLA